MNTSEIQNKACHNCRRKRLKCDRNVPSCLKCVQRGYECLGYKSLFRWDQGLASRGKLRGVTFESLAGAKERSSIHEPQLLRVVADPLLQDLCYASRRYVAYFASNVCPDLVLYDTPYRNPFRELIPLTQRYPCLLQIIIATSALHMSNASEGHLAIPSLKLTYDEAQSPLESNDLAVSRKNRNDSALTAKQRALRLLNMAIGTMGPEDLDGILATVLLFVQFEIMDTGQNQWKDHVRGARSLIDMVYRSERNAAEPMSTLRRCLISNCLVYDIFGTTFNSPEDLVPSETILNGALSLLQDAEGNHCSSFPMPLLYLIQNGARLSKGYDYYEDSAACIAREGQTYLLLESARSFDPYSWAAYVQTRSPHPDLAVRTHLASAHQAATCIYLHRVLLKKPPTPQMLQDLEDLSLKIRHELSNISPSDPLNAATAWPSFIAGAEAKDSAMESWAQNQFENIWAVQPWGLVKGALVVLKMIWTRRRRYEDCKNTDLPVDLEWDENWVTYMKRTGVDWLIL